MIVIWNTWPVSLSQQGNMCHQILLETVKPSHHLQDCTLSILHSISRKITWNKYYFKVTLRSKQAALCQLYLSRHPTARSSDNIEDQAPLPMSPSFCSFSFCWCLWELRLDRPMIFHCRLQRFALQSRETNKNQTTAWSDCYTLPFLALYTFKLVTGVLCDRHMQVKFIF